LPEKDLQRGEIAESNHALEIGEALFQSNLRGNSTRIHPAGHEAINHVGIQRSKKTVKPLSEGPANILRFRVLIDPT